MKNPSASEQGRILFHDIGDYLTRRKSSASSPSSAASAASNALANGRLSPPTNTGLAGQRDTSFEAFMPIGDKDGPRGAALFENYSSGVKTQRDAWCFNPSRQALTINMNAMIAAYNSELSRFNVAYPDANRASRANVVNAFVDTDAKKISWSDGLKTSLVAKRELSFDPSSVVAALYRPFSRQHLYYNRSLNERVYQMPRIFPLEDQASENRVIMVKQRANSGSQIALMVGAIPELQSDGGTQCFPRWLYEFSRYI